MTIDYHESNKQAVTTAAWAPDGQSFVTGKLHGDNRLCLWSESGHQLHSWAVNYRVQDCAISPDGQRLVVISNESHIIVYNFATREEEYSILQKNQMTSIQISKDSRYMLINMANCEVQLIDIETAEMHRRFLGQKQGEYVIRGTFGGADQNLIISGSEGQLWIGGRSNQKFKRKGLTIHSDTKIYIWHRENGTLIERLEGHTTGCINVIAWNPTDPCMFASGGDDKKVRMYASHHSHSIGRLSR